MLTFMLLYNYQMIQPYYQLISYLLKCHPFTALDVNGFYQQSTPHIKGNILFLDLNGASASHYSSGIHYFNILYRSPITFSFANCKYDYKNNKNLYAMMLPLYCKVVTINPRSSIEFAAVGGRKNSDGNLKYSLTLTKRSHVIIM